MRFGVFFLLALVAMSASQAMATGTSAKHSLTKLSALRSMVSGKHHLVSAVGVSKVMPSVVALDGPEQPAQTPAGCKSALQLLEEDKDNFSILLSAIKATGTTSLLDMPSFVGTLFAPNDAAFTKALDNLDVDVQELYDDVLTLTSILKFHLVPGLALQRSDFKDSQTYSTLLETKKKTTEIFYDLVIVKDLKTGTTDYRSMNPGRAKFDPAKNLQPGCPTAVYVISSVLLPPEIEPLAKLAASAIRAADVYTEAGSDIDRKP